jgi:hypothetical protein
MGASFSKSGSPERNSVLELPQWSCGNHMVYRLGCRLGFTIRRQQAERDARTSASC